MDSDIDPMLSALLATWSTTSRLIQTWESEHELFLFSTCHPTPQALKNIARSMFRSGERLFSLSVVLGAITSFAAAQNCSQLHMVCSFNAIAPRPAKY